MESWKKQFHNRRYVRASLYKNWMFEKSQITLISKKGKNYWQTPLWDVQSTYAQELFSVQINPRYIGTFQLYGSKWKYFSYKLQVQPIYGIAWDVNRPTDWEFQR